MRATMNISYLNVIKVFPLLFCLNFSTLLGFVKENGMGTVGTSYPQSSNSANYNPAGITDLEDRYDIGAGVIYQNAHTSVKGSTLPLFNVSASTSQGKYLPLAIAGACKQVTQNLYAGVSIDGTRVFKGSSSKIFPMFGNRKQGAENFIAIFVPTLAWRLNAQHSFGISLPISFARTKTKGLENGAINSLYPDNYTNRGYDWAYGFGVRLGWLWHVTPCLNFGLYYSPRLLTASHFHKYKGAIAVRGKLEVPAALRTGFTWFLGRSHLVFEIEYQFNRNERTLANSPFSPYPAGSSRGPALGWKNQLATHIGADYRLNSDWVVRAGLFTYFGPSARSSTTIAHFLAPIFITKNILSAGLTWEPYCDTEISVFYNYLFHRKLKGKPLPTLLNGRVDLEYQAHVVMLGVGKKF